MRHFFLLVQKEVAKEKHPKGGHASVSPFGIPPLGADNTLGGASGRIYCLVPTKLLLFSSRSDARGWVRRRVRWMLEISS